MVRSRVGVFLLLVAAVALTWWLWDLYRLPARGELAAYWQLVVAVVTLVVAVIPLVNARRAVGEHGADALDAEIADRLAQAVGTQWDVAAGQRGLLFPNAIPVRWTRPREAVAGPVAAAVRSGHVGRLPGVVPVPRDLLASGDVVRDLHDVYAGPGSGRLLIVGPPGSGKSGAAVLLVRKALAHRATVAPGDRPGVPVPVLFTLQGWNPETEWLDDWLVSLLRRTYVGIFAGRRSDAQARRLLKRGRIAVVLDGLDEIDPALRPTVLEALDEQAISFRLVLLSRSAEMATAARHRLLRGAVAVELRDVAPGTAADYVQGFLPDPPPPSWQDLLRRLRTAPSSSLTRALRNPLTLTLLRDTYGDDSVDALLGSHLSRADIETHLLERVIPTAFRHQRGDPRPRYGPEHAERVLRLLAQRMDRDHTADLAWWRIASWTPRFPRALVVGLVVGLASWPLVRSLAAEAISPFLTLALGGVLGAWLVNRPEAVPTRWPTLLSGPVFVFAAGVVIGLTLLNATIFLRALPLAHLLFACSAVVLVAGCAFWVLHRTLGWGRPPAAAPPASGLPAVLLVTGIALGFVIEGGAILFLSPFWWSAGMLVLGLLVLGLGLTFGLGSSRPRAADATTPDRSWRQYRWAALGMWLALAVFAGGGLQITVLSVEGLRFFGPLVSVVGVLILAGLWIAFGLLLGTTFPESWEATLACAQLAVSRRSRLPVGLMSFLEYATRRKVLRTVGPVYQFRHERLQALLAGRSLPAASGPQDRLAARYGAVAAQEALTVVATAIRRDETEDESGDDAEEEIAWWRVPYWVGPAPRALVIGLAAAAACWLGQLAVDPGLWLTVLSGATTLAVGLGAALAVFVPRRREVDEPDARWAFLLRHPILVLGGGAALGCSLGKSLAGLFTDALLVQLTLGLPIGVALWLLFGLVALAIDKDRREQVLTSWRSVHTNLPLVFVVGAGLGWLAAKAMTLVGTVPYWIVLTVVGAAVLGLLLVLGFARLGSGPPSVDDAPYDSWNHRRWTLLVLWFVLGGLVSNIVPESGMRAWLLVGLVPWPVGWVVALGLAVASGYVVGLMFPRSWSASLAWLQVALPRRPRLPVHLMEFLDDARDRGIVRADGPVYRFPSAAAAPVMADARSDTP